MKIDLEYPYSERWRRGYIVVNPERRQTVILYNTDKDRSSVSYARYLMAVNLGRFLEPDEHVDHIDNYKTNDSINNLQILTQTENTRKSAKGRTFLKFICPVCKRAFELESRQSHRVNPACSRKCGRMKSNNRALLG